MPYSDSYSRLVRPKIWCFPQVEPAEFGKNRTLSAR